MVHWGALAKSPNPGFLPPLAWGLPRPHLTASVFPNPPHLPLGDQRCVPASSRESRGVMEGSHYVARLCAWGWHVVFDVPK